jgi:hypothetical protein
MAHEVKTLLSQVDSMDVPSERKRRKPERARLFALTDNDWRDVATGSFSFHHPTSREAKVEEDGERQMHLVIGREDDPTVIMWQCHVGEDTRLTRQQDTVVSWTDADTGQDYALSFEHVEGCQSFWLAYQHCFMIDDDDDPNDVSNDGGDDDGDKNAGGLELPRRLNLEDLPAIAERLAGFKPSEKVPIVRHILQCQYLQQLVVLHREHPEDAERIRHCLQTLVALGSILVYTHLVRDDVYLDITSIFGRILPQFL